MARVSKKVSAAQREMCIRDSVHSARLIGKYAGENRAGTGWDRVDSG